MEATEARAVFRAQRDAFARRYPAMRNVTFHIVNRACPDGFECAPRDLAWYVAGRVYLLRRALRLGRNKVSALIAHELGHAADRRRWERGSEQRADDIAEKVLGRVIRYDRRTLVQTFGPGIYPRPMSLHT